MNTDERRSKRHLLSALIRVNPWLNPTFFQLLAGAVCLSALASAQSAETRPSFEIAEVRASPSTRNPYLRNFGLRGGRYEMRYATMVDLIKTAWDVEAEKVVGGPNWL